MTIKADWGQSALDGCADLESEPARTTRTFDPFDAARSALSMINLIDSKMPVSGVCLETPVEELHRMLSISIRREARLDAAGVTCALKEKAECSCLACPFNKSQDDHDPKQSLCRIGMEQNILTTYILAQEQGETVGVCG